jgi:XapX domain-containing protein
LECCVSVNVYAVSLLAGILAGALYGLLGVRSPAPPVVALVGLLGLLVGEQIVTLGKRLVRGEAITRSWVAHECVPQVTGVHAAAPTAVPPKNAPENP